MLYQVDTGNSHIQCGQELHCATAASSSRAWLLVSLPMSRVWYQQPNSSPSTWGIPARRQLGICEL